MNRTSILTSIKYQYAQKIPAYLRQWCVSKENLKSNKNTIVIILDDAK